MDARILEQLIATLMDETFERLQVRDRVKEVTICLSEPVALRATIIDGTSRGSTWAVTAREKPDNPQH